MDSGTELKDSKTLSRIPGAQISESYTGGEGGVRQWKALKLNNSRTACRQVIITSADM